MRNSVHYNQNTKTASLYIHWPFCPYKCHFCPFVALASHDQFMERYHKALIAEIERFADEQVEPVSIKTIHFGGGTPSTYPPALLIDMMCILNKRFVIEPEAEIAFEVNPGTVSLEKMKVWKEVGINRVSIGVQGVKDKALQSLNRHQTATQVLDLIAHASTLFDNISIDLIVGLPGVTSDDWQSLIKQAMEWPLAHISIYFLTIHENTPLYFKVQANQVALPDDKEVVALYEWTCDTLAQHGFEQYELSNFARPGYASKHNMAYWNRDMYKGFGIGACSFDGKYRFQNEKNIMNYMALCEQGEPCVTFAEELTEYQAWLEVIMLGLRRPQGVSWDVIRGEKGWELRQGVLQRFVDEGYIEYITTGVRLTRRGLTVENEILAQLVQK